MIPVFISGPHGCGKTMFIKNLLKNEKEFVLDNYNIDFVNELDSISVMTIYEKCLLRLYHRFYTAEQAILKCKNTSDKKILLVDRSIYDSMVYNKVEYDIGEITQKQYSFLNEIAECALEIVKPYTVILNPNSAVVVDYLKQRMEQGERKNRDKLCAREDTLEYITRMNIEYTKFYDGEKIYHIDNQDVEEIDKVHKWIKREVFNANILRQ